MYEGKPSRPRPPPSPSYLDVEFVWSFAFFSDNFVVSILFCDNNNNKQAHGKIQLASVFLKEVIQQSKDLLDDDAITDIIKTCNVIKNEKVQLAKRKSKGQAQKAKKQDKQEKAKAQKVANETFGDSNAYDKYDEMGDDYEDGFF